jgi:hypothetical protein
MSACIFTDSIEEILEFGLVAFYQGNIVSKIQIG